MPTTLSEKYCYNNGFTLIELSIVLVILGLIVGGIVGGRTLIHAAEIQKVYSDVNKYKTAVNTFFMAYDALPGDMKDASDYWGAACGGAAAAPAGCNGDGNGEIVQVDQPNTEAFRFWQHLSLAELVPQQYTGVGTPNFVPGINVPTVWKADKSSVVSPGYMPRYNISRNMLLLASNPIGNQGTLPVKDAYNIDKKYDDGRPDNGLMLASDGWSGGWVPGCTNISTGVPPATYDPALGGVCRVYFILD